MGEAPPFEDRKQAMNDTSAMAHKVSLSSFLACNPFPAPFTDGLFFRDKMRAIHRMAPASVTGSILEVGGGQSGLTKMLYPHAQVTVLDADPRFADAPANQRSGVRFVAGDATDLPFADGSFALVTMFDLLEHVENDGAVAREALRVLAPGGRVLLTTPHRERWRFPYHAAFGPVSPPEEELFAEWGHVRRGYTEQDLDRLFDARRVSTGGFINGLLAVSHDIAFSRLKRPVRLALHAIFAPLSAAGYYLNRNNSEGTELAVAYQR